ncbi:MAG: tRNA lysidine(34) synthetase TilS [Candidatus Bipolaricaulaceae bacterium]
MLPKVREALRRYRMVAPGERVLVAVSGGADSMALLYSLYWLRREFGLSLAIAHLDHGIRPDTAEDLQVVKAAAEDLGLPLLHERVDVPAYAREKKLNLEEAARRLRREFLRRAAQRLEAQKIALGHTRTDLAETVLLHLLRGAGPAGLRGFLPVVPPFIRPLVLVSRAETRSFCQEHAIPFRDDPTNYDTRLTRNAIRLELLPLLRKYNAQAEEALARAAELLGQTQEVLAWTAQRLLAELRRDRGLDLAKLRELPPPVQALLVRALAHEHGIALYRKHVEAVLRALARGEAAEVHLPQGLLARLGGGLFVVERATPVPPGPWALEVPGETEIPALGLAVRAEKLPRPAELDTQDLWAVYVSPARVRPPLAVRVPTRTDRIVPFGRTDTVRVWDLLAKEGVPRWERTRWPLVVDERGVVWVVGLRLNREYAVLPEDAEVLRISARRL